MRPHRVVMQPLPKEEIEKARELRLKELQMFDVFREIAFYIIFFCTLIFITYSLRDPNAYVLKNELTRLFITPNNGDWAFTGVSYFLSFNLVFIHRNLNPTIFIFPKVSSNMICCFRWVFDLYWIFSLSFILKFYQRMGKDHGIHICKVFIIFPKSSLCKG